MNKDALSKVVDYADVYAIVAQGIENVDEVKLALKKNDTNPGNMKRRNEFLSKNEQPYLQIEGGEITYDYRSLADELEEFDNFVLPKSYLAEKREQVEKLEKENDDLTDKYKKEIEDLKKTIAEQKKQIKMLREKRRELSGKLARAEMERKVLVASSIEVGPKEGKMDDVFLVDPKDYLDLDEYVSIYGGELDSFFKDNPADPVEEPKTEEDKFKPGKELTERNYALKLMKHIGTALFFKKRVDDTKAVKEKEARVGQLFPGVDDNKTERQLERDKIIRNRCRSLNMIIECDRLTNQEKLMMYAMMTQYHNTFVERLLNWAGKHCINANYLIPILEDRSTSYNYENTIMFLEQFAEASEFKMKLDLARELIEGKWYIVADYNGKKTKFQLVPLEEFNELRQMVGLPVSEFHYREDKPEEKRRNVEEVAKEPPKAPDFVEHITSKGSETDLMDDGYEPAKDDSEELDLPYK